MATYPNTYPIYDSLKNFRIKVKLERVVTASDSSTPSFPAFLRQRAAMAPDEASAPSPYPFARMDMDSESEEYVFKWQEKVFSRSEYLRYSDEANCKTVLQKQYYKDILELHHSGGPPTKRLFAYIEGDEYQPIEERVENLTISSASPSYLVEKMAAIRHRRVAPRQQGRIAFRTNPVINLPSQEAIRKAHTTSNIVQTMRIMADLGTKDAEKPDPKDEHVICVLKVINDNRLSIEPDFNYGSTNKPYKIESRVGVFQYILEHISVKLTLEDVEDQKKREASLNEYKAGILKGQVGSDFDVPEEGVLKLLLLCEIIEARHFEYDGLFVHYFVELPKGWYSSSDVPLFGVTQLCRTSSINLDEVAYFSFPFECSLSYNMNSIECETGQLPRWPQLFLEVMSLDSWNRFRIEGYGYATLPTMPGTYETIVSTWRPTDGRPQTELRRFFIGGSSELEELDFAGMPKKFDENKLSKFGFQSVASGDIRLKFMILHQSRSFVASERQQQLKYGALLEKIGASVGLHSSIVSILEAFQKARQRMIAVRENILDDQGLFPV